MLVWYRAAVQVVLQEKLVLEADAEPGDVVRGRVMPVSAEALQNVATETLVHDLLGASHELTD